MKVKALGNDYCPVSALRRYMLLRGNYKGNLFCFQDKEPVPYLWYAKTFKDLVITAGLNQALKPHSAGIGAATPGSMKIRSRGFLSLQGYFRLSVLSL